MSKLAWLAIFAFTGYQFWLLKWLKRNNGGIMATLNEILESFKSWGTSWKVRALKAEDDNGDLKEALSAAQESAARSAQELADFIADDEATDAEQILGATQAANQAAAEAAQEALDAALAADLPDAEDEPELSEGDLDETKDAE